MRFLMVLPGKTTPALEEKLVNNTILEDGDPFVSEDELMWTGS